MKLSPIIYARAFCEVITSFSRKEHRKIIQRFLKVVERRGDISRFGEIIKAVNKIVVKKRGGRLISIEAARPLGETKLKNVTTLFSGKDYWEVKINPKLVAGLRITVDENQQLDYSLQRKLKKLFPS